MPHIDLVTTAFDLEMEVHLDDSEQEFLDYVESLLKGEKVENKYQDIIQLSPPDNIELAEYLLNDNMIKILMIKFFNENVYKHLMNLAKGYN